MAIVAVAIVPASAALPLFIYSIHQERAREVRDMALRTSQIAALEIERIVRGTEAVLQTMALAPAVRSFGGPGFNGYIADVAERLPQIRGFAVADAQGRVRCVTGLSFGADGAAGESWFDPAFRQENLVVGGYTKRSDEAAYLPVALPIGAPGAHSGVIVAGIDLDWLGARLRERNLAQGSALAIADGSGIIIAREPDSATYVGKPINPQVLPLVHATSPGVGEVTGRDGTRRIVGYQPADTTATGLYVGASVSTGSAFSQSTAATWRSVALAVVGALAACAIAWAVGDRLFSKPIRRILDTIASWRAGDETARTGIAPGGSELTEIATSIDEYMDSLVLARAEGAAAEELRILVLNEMNHRIKNILAAVQAVANQTFKGTASPERMRAFASRLQAMAATHDLLIEGNWKSAELRKAVEAVLAPFDNDRAHRFALEGPSLQTDARAALALSMALHELCTNAAKYGALSVPGGRVTIRWRLEGDRFHMSWTEAGGPPVVEPQHTGFGSQLIRAALASEVRGTVALCFPPEGVRFTLDADATRVLAAKTPEAAAG